MSAAENVASGKFSRGASGALSYVSTVGFSPRRKGSITEDKETKAEKDGKKDEKEKEEEKERDGGDSDDDEADVARNVSVRLC